MKLLVLAGGQTSEREVSLNTGRAIADGLMSLGHSVKMIDTGNGRELLNAENRSQIDSGSKVKGTEAPAIPHSTDLFIPPEFRDYDCVFIALHGGIGEDGTLQALLDLAGVAYTGSGVLASALAMDKYRAKLMFQSAGVPTPATFFYGGEAAAFKYCGSEGFDQALYPIVVKPNREGSTVGLTIAKNYEELLKGISAAVVHDDSILIEEFIPGRELTVAVLGGVALPVIEIVPKSGFYDYHSKYTQGASEYICPAVIEKIIESEVKELASLAYEVLGCSGYARADFRLSPENELYCLEVNTLPGMTSTSLVPKAAKAAGMSFEQLLEKIITLATAKP